MFDLSGRIALVTGSGRRVGLGIAKCLGSQGATVVINDYYSDRAKEALEIMLGEGYKAIAVVCDVTDPNSVAEMIAQVERELGSVDILVNNVGLPPGGMDMKPFRQMESEQWDLLIDLNLKSILNCVSKTIDGMCDRGWGRIITITSDSWRTGNNLGTTLYAAGKAGGVGFTKQLSSEVGGDGVTVNCISLGMMNTVKNVDKIASRFPIPRAGSPEDIGAAAVYLASNEASWVTGQCMVVNGGVVTA